MQIHDQPPPTSASLAAVAAGIAAATDTLMTAANTRRGADDGLDAAASLLRAVDRIIAAVITVLQTSDHQRVIADHGIVRDSWLRAIANRTGADAGMLLAAAERLGDMPAVSAWFRQGVLSWGAVRAIVASTRNLTAAQRGWVDATLAEHGDDVVRLDGDQVAAAVEGLVDRARPDLAREREAAALRGRWLTIQPRLDGTADIHGSLDPETAAAALAAFDTTTPTGHDHDHHGDDADDADDAHDGTSDADVVRAARRRSNVDIFGDLCRQRVTRHTYTAHDPDTDGDAADGDADGTDGDRGEISGAGDNGAVVGGTRASTVSGGRCGRCGSAPSAARPAFLVVADLSALDPDAPVGSGIARLHWATSRAPVELTPAAARRLACDATLRVVVTDGAEVLGVTAAHPKVSATLRAALVVRDGGCRFPGCGQPVEVCDSHHLVPVESGGATVLANLALLCRDHHHAIHDGGWHATLHADAAMTFARRGVTRSSVPRGRQHPPPVRPPPAGRPRRGHTTRPTGHPPDPHTDIDSDGEPARPDPADALLPF